MIGAFRSNTRWSKVNVPGRGGGGGEQQGPRDRETMFSQLAKRSARQRFLERAGKFSDVISPVSAARVQC